MRFLARLPAGVQLFSLLSSKPGLLGLLATMMATAPRLAETVAQRAVTANASNAQAWFVLAYTRGQLNNREGSREARTRCIARGRTSATSSPATT